MFSADVTSILGNYVYRLIDPRDFQTFYVGRGVGNRVFHHAKDELNHFEDDEDALTTKLQQIREIRLSGKEVICVIHRYGLTKEQAMEVESALIDCYPGLTNLVSGYGSDRGVITADDLQSSFERPIYEEPTEIDYIIVPMYKYLDKLLSLEYQIVYHLDGLYSYYTLSVGKDLNILEGIMQKFYSRWEEKSKEKKRD